MRGKRFFVWGLLALIALFVAIVGKRISEVVVTMVQTERVVVIDSGHGGVDPGKVGCTGTLEKQINLEIAKRVKKKLEKKKIKVIMTRETDEGLYHQGDSNKKISDLKARIELLEKEKPYLCVSIHQNSFPDASVRGAQVFYYTDSEIGKEMAEIMQKTIVEKLNDGNHRMAKGNRDYYMLRKSAVPLIIVECGFLSNPNEEALLKNEDYQEKMADSITTGIEKCLIK